MLTLADYPDDMVRIECAKCSRTGLLNKARLIAEYGAGIPLPDLRHGLPGGGLLASSLERRPI